MRYLRRSEQGAYLADHLKQHGWAVVDTQEVSLRNTENTARRRLHAAARHAGLEVTTERLGDMRVLGYTNPHARETFYDVQERVAGRWMAQDAKHVVAIEPRERDRSRPGRPDR